MGYVRTHWHSLLIGAAALWVTERFILPRFMGQGS